MGKQRLDTLLAERGLFASRTRAAASVMAGEVLLGSGARVASKPGEMVSGDVVVALKERQAYVSRGGVKLANALAETGLEVAGRVALDVGASTGGFTDCLLAHGASRVIALDVAYGQLDWKLRTDERVDVIERCNARNLTRAMLPVVPDLVVIDVSFISLAKVLPAVLSCLPARHDVLALVKPQFEVGAAKVGKGGVVRDASLRREALIGAASAAIALSAAVMGFAYSGLPGPKGNRESFVWLVEAGREGSTRSEHDLRRLAQRAEP
jgi:23S rRNA (cytidine1920-2'-O)/16S rRNA (cytidine1409-2'-O)-methyltransferase